MVKLEGFEAEVSLKVEKSFKIQHADRLSFILSSVRNSYLRTKRTPASAPANHCSAFKDLTSEKIN